MNDILSWLMFLITFLIGYFLGQGKLNGQSLVELKKQAGKLLDTSRVGAIKRPSPKDLFFKQNPKLKEEAEAMSDTLKQIL